jgi:hypothetical protein
MGLKLGAGFAAARFAEYGAELAVVEGAAVGGCACWVRCGGGAKFVGAGGGAAGSALKSGARHFQHEVPPFSRMRMHAEHDAMAVERAPVLRMRCRNAYGGSFTYLKTIL